MTGWGTKGSLVWCRVRWKVGSDHPGGSVVKNLPANAGGLGLTPGWRRSPGSPGKSHGQRSLVGLQTTGLQKSWTWLSNQTTTRSGQRKFQRWYEPGCEDWEHKIKEEFKALHFLKRTIPVGMAAKERGYSMRKVGREGTGETWGFLPISQTLQASSG